MSSRASAVALLRQHSSLVVALLAVLVAYLVMGLFRKPLDVKGKRCYVTGGSSGLGRALSEELVRRGAHVTVVARDVKKLEETAEALRSLASPSQLISHISADLTSSESSEKALATAVSSWGGRAPDHVYLCAGFARPRFFVDVTTEHLKEGLDGVYWVAAYTAHSAIKRMVSQRIRGKVVFVSSFLGYTTFAGYSSYSPGKYALRGLADALRSEMLLHDISIHIYMSAGILGPGFDAENKDKPAITHKIEEGDKPVTPFESARALISGIEKGHYQICNLLVTDLVRTQAAGAVPGNNVLVDTMYWLISGIGLPIWRMITDSQVRAARKEVLADLETRGFYSVPK